jgi:hypothetical protein
VTTISAVLTAFLSAFPTEGLQVAQPAERDAGGLRWNALTNAGVMRAEVPESLRRDWSRPTEPADDPPTVRRAREDYRARCDGTGDDTAAIQAAIEAVHATGGGVVTLPEGTCIVTNVRLYERITLEGGGTHETVLRARAALSARDRLTNDGAGHDYDGVAMLYNTYPGDGPPLARITIRDLTIDGNADAQVVGGAKNLWGIYLNKVTRATIANVEVRNCLSHGITLKQATASAIRSVVVERNGRSKVLWDGRRDGNPPGGDGICLLAGSSDNLVTDSTARDNGSIGFEDEGRFGAYRASNRNARNRWVGLISENNGDHGFLFLFTDGSRLERSTAVGGRTTGINLVGTQDTVISGVYVSRPGGDGITVRPETYGPDGTNRGLTVEDATIRDTGGVGIRVEALQVGTIRAVVRGVSGGRAVSLSGAPSSDVTLAVDYDGAGQVPYGIYSYDATNLTIVDSILQGSTGRDVWIDGTAGGVTGLVIDATKLGPAGLRITDGVAVAPRIALDAPRAAP